jgi:beta-galactosidase
MNPFAPGTYRLPRRACAILAAAGMVVAFAAPAARASTAASTGASAGVVGAVPLSGRTVDLAAGWKFVLANPDGITDPDGRYEGAPEPDYDDSSWRTVNVPHDWSIELTPTAAPGTGTGAGTGFLQGGLGWYRKRFALPPSARGKRIAIEFDGVYMDSQVYVNGALLGGHRYGYTGFAFDLTGKVHTDGRTPNVVAVKVQNRLPSSRWYSGSGIYRNVRLTVTDPVHVPRWGTFVTTPGLRDTIRSWYATVRVQTDVANEGGVATPVSVATSVRNARGQVVARAVSHVTPGPRQTARSTVDLRVNDPVLWSFDNPSLYAARTQLSVAGKIVDTYDTRFGIRHFRIDPGEGFSLNGEYTKIRGVNLHHDLGALGAATSRDALVRQMTIMKGMGVNALRTAHNPPSPELVEICDELGIVMLVEAFDTWQNPKTPFDYARFFEANADADIKEMVNAAKNSPAVIMWSIGNEIRGQTVATAERLVGDIRSIDTTRPIVWGHDGYRSVPSDGSVNDRIARLLDGVGLNYNTAQSVDALHAKYPDKFFFESESSSSTSSRGAYQDPELRNTGENYTPGRRATSSYDNNLAPWTMSGEYGLKKDRDRKFFIGEFLWSGFDYIGEPTPYFDNFPVKSSFFGATDTAGFPKDLYYLFQSQWTSRPIVHLVPMNWTDHKPGEQVEVWAYANVDTVELILNGRSLGVRRFDRKTTTFGTSYLETTEPTGDDKNFPSGSYTSPNGGTGKLHLTWKVPFEPGSLVAIARRDGREVARDRIDTAGAPHAIRLRPDRRSVDADGRSLAFVTAEVVDREGVTVPGATVPVTVRVDRGELAGLDSGRQESDENYRARTRLTWGGKALAMIRASGRPGPITINATAPGLRTATTTISATATGDPPVPAADPVVRDWRPPAAPLADASFSGTAATVPTAMLDGDLATAWSNFYRKDATALLPAISAAHASEWVSVESPRPRRINGPVHAFFTTGSGRVLPSSLKVSYWDGHRYAPVPNLHISWATGSNQPTTITFDPVTTSSLRFDMTSPAPGTPDGFLQIAELRVP